jgi:hypothetical protein
MSADDTDVGASFAYRPHDVSARLLFQVNIDVGDAPDRNAARAAGRNSEIATVIGMDADMSFQAWRSR